VHFIDVKGKPTAMFITKKKMVEAMHGVEIECVRRIKGNRFERVYLES
jgi:hypothetical protein